MGTHHHDQKVPLGALVGAAALILASLALATQARSAAVASEAPPAAVRRSIDLRFEDRPDGSVAVLEASTNREVDVVPPEQGGFVRGVMRGMFRTRKLESIDPAEEFALVRRQDGALVIEDPHSGRAVDLRSFGAANYEAFARLLDAKERSR